MDDSDISDVMDDSDISDVWASDNNIWRVNERAKLTSEQVIYSRNAWILTTAPTG